MKLILQIAVGVFIAELAMHAIIRLEEHHAAPQASTGLPAVPSKPPPLPQTAASAASPTSAPADQGCSHEQINGKTYNCCRESARDPTVRSCTAVPTR